MVKGGRGGAGRGAGRSYGHSHSRSYGHSHSYGRSHGYGGSRYGYSRYGGSRYGHSRYGRCGYGYGYGCRYIGGRMYRSYGYGGTQDAVALYEQQMDGIHNVPLSPVFFNGALTLFGNDTRVTNLLNTVQSVAEYQNPDNLTVMMAQPIYQEMTMDQYFPNGVLPPNQSEIQMQTNISFQGTQVPSQPQQPHYQVDPIFQGLTFTPEMGDDMIVEQVEQRMKLQMQQQMNTGVTQLNAIAVGQKDQGSSCCHVLTLIFACLIFPLFFMCCNWWKKIVYPKYCISSEFYRAVGQFVRNNAACTTVKLTICDSQFNGEKVNILRDGLMSSSIQSLTVVNMAKAINYNNNQVDDFLTNVQPLKEMPFTTAFIWDQQAA